MKKEEIKDLLSKLVDIKAEGAAPIELSIGITKDNIVQGDCVVLKSAPPIVAQKLQEYGYHLDITHYGVRVEKY